MRRRGTHTAKHRALVANSSSQNLQEVLAHLRGEEGFSLLLNRRRFGGTETTHVVEVDHGIVGKGKVEGRTHRRHHSLWSRHQLLFCLAQSSDVQLTGAESQLGQSSSRADEGLLTAPDPAIGALTTMVISREIERCRSWMVDGRA